MSLLIRVSIYSVCASILLQIFRMFKLTRHFTASKVLFETARKMWKQILGT